LHRRSLRKPGRTRYLLVVLATLPVESISNLSSSRAAPTRDLSMDTTQNTGPTAEKPASKTWYCFAGTIITLCTRAGLPARRRPPARFSSKISERSRSQASRPYRALPIIEIYRHGSTTCFSKQASTARRVPRNGSRASALIGRWRCRRYAEIRQDPRRIDHASQSAGRFHHRL